MGKRRLRVRESNIGAQEYYSVRKKERKEGTETDFLYRKD